MVRRQPADYTFFATDYDPEKGGRACRRLADAFAGGRDPRSADIREAMAAATAAFPGLQEFVDAMDERSLDPEDAMMDVTRVRAEHAGPVLGAKAKLAWLAQWPKRLNVSTGMTWSTAQDSARRHSPNRRRDAVPGACCPPSNPQADRGGYISGRAAWSDGRVVPCGIAARNPVTGDRNHSPDGLGRNDKSITVLRSRAGKPPYGGCDGHRSGAIALRHI